MHDVTLEKVSSFAEYAVVLDDLNAATVWMVPRGVAIELPRRLRDAGIP